MIDWIDDLKNQFWKDPRMEDLTLLASELGFTFIRREHFNNQSYPILGFKLFKGKKPRRLKGIMQGSDPGRDLKVRIYDYVYYADDKKKVTTVFELASPQFNFPQFSIQPKGAGYYIKDFFAGNRPIPFDYHEEFTKHYFASSKIGYDLESYINSAVIEQILSEKGIRMEGHKRHLLVYVKNHMVPAKEIKSRYQYVQKIVDLLRYDEEDEYV